MRHGKNIEQQGNGETLARHRVTRSIVAVGMGLALAIYAFQFVSDPRPAERRAREEAAVHAARDFLNRYIPSPGGLEIVDPLAPRRAIGKVYVYPRESGMPDSVNNGYEVSGYYRRGEEDSWHPFLIKLDSNSGLIELAVRDADAALRRRAEEDARLIVRDR